MAKNMCRNELLISHINFRTCPKEGSRFEFQKVAWFPDGYFSLLFAVSA